MPETTVPMPPGEPALRRGAPGDAEKLSAFMREVFTQAFGPQNNPEDMRNFFDEAYVPAAQYAELVDPKVTTVLATLGEGDAEIFAGYAQVRDNDHTPADIQGPRPIELQRFYVDRAFHGRGLAQRLMVEVFADARRRGGETLWLGVWEQNPRGMAFYRKFGFRHVGKHVFPIGKDIQYDLLMEVPLDAAGIAPGATDVRASGSAPTT